MKSRIVRLRETFLTQKHCLAGKDFRHHRTLWSGFSGSLMKILQNCTFRINSHELNGARRRSGRVVECTGLENRRTLTRTVGSNPTSSAIIKKIIFRNNCLLFFIEISPHMRPHKRHVYVSCARDLVVCLCLSFYKSASYLYLCVQGSTLCIQPSDRTQFLLFELSNYHFTKHWRVISTMKM